jgi:hypothetical protein
MRDSRKSYWRGRHSALICHEDDIDQSFGCRPRRPRDPGRLFVFRASADEADARFSFHSTRVPGEYLYIDTVRIRAYLAQIQGGLSASEKQETTVTRSAEANVTGSGLGVKVGGQSQRFVAREVTPTNTSNLLRLLDLLKDSDVQSPIRVRAIDANVPAAAFRRDVLALHEGDFVELLNARVLLPPYAQPYNAIRGFGSRPITSPPTPRNEPQQLDTRSSSGVSSHASCSTWVHVGPKTIRQHARAHVK